MVRRMLNTAVVVALGLFAAEAQALVIGIAGAPNAADAVTAAGHTPQIIADLSSPLGGFDVVWVLNGDTGSGGLALGNEQNLIDYVMGGGVLSFHDRNVTTAADYIPGAGGIAFVRDTTLPESAEINVQTGGTPVTNGPGGIIDDTSLDGGNFSNHGFAQAGTLPVGAMVILNNGNQDQAVDFFYGFGAGFVYYSSIPLDFYLGGSGTNPPADAFRDIYAVNEVAFQASLAGPGQVVPEPTTLALLGLGLVGIGIHRRRRAHKN